MYDLDLVLIFGFIIVVTAITGIAVNGIVSKVLSHRSWERQNERENQGSNSKVTGIADRTGMIEDRLRVLERLATDRGQLLADEIESLRDLRDSKTALERSGS